MPRFSIIQAVALYDTRITPRHITVLSVLGVHTDNDGYCYPSMATVGAILGVSRQAAQKSADHLVECGYVEKFNRKRANGSQKSNMYRVIMDYFPPEKYLRKTDVRCNPQLHPLQPPVAPPATPEVAPPATPEVAPPATPEVAPITTHKNVPYNDPERERGVSTEIEPEKVAPEVAPPTGQQHSASLIPDDYHPPDTITAQLFRAGRPDVDPFDKTLIAKFISHHKGNGTLSPDWDAKFFNWCLREKKEGKNENSQPDTRSRAKRFADKLDQIAKKDIETRGGIPENVG